MNTRRPVIGATLAVAMALAGCSDSMPYASLGATAATPTATGTLASVEVRGGECLAAATCDTTIYLDADGRIHVAAKPPNDLGVATPAQVATLRAAIDATDFTALRRPVFNGTCPTAYDGQELVFEFTTTHGLERLASCESALDLTAPVFAALATALGGASPFGAAK